MPSNRGARVCRLLLALILLSGLTIAMADPAPEASKQAAEAARDAVRKALIKGPASIAFKDQAVLALPEHFGFIPQKEAAALMATMGNQTGPQFLGLIVPLAGAAGGGEWFVSAQYEPAGYIKDDDARHWDADKLLQSLKDGTEAGNEERQRVGVAPIEVTRWIEAPKYEPGSHRLVWSAEAKLKNAADPDPTINYNTYVLGREGYISLDLVTSASRIGGDKSAAQQLLGAVDFKSGKRYTDFNSSTDKVAAYGLAALIAGVAAKKLGLLALIAATAVKFAKVIAIAVAAFGAAIMRWFKGRLGRKEPTV